VIIKRHRSTKLGYAYNCPPCDNDCDTIAHEYSGICPVCKMQLVEKLFNLGINQKSTANYIFARIRNPCIKRFDFSPVGAWSLGRASTGLNSNRLADSLRVLSVIMELVRIPQGSELKANPTGFCSDQFIDQLRKISKWKNNCTQ